MSAVLSMLLGCSANHEPRANEVHWQVKKAAEGKGYRLTGDATLAKGVEGLYQPTAILTDDHGCRHETTLPNTMIGDASSAGTTYVTFDQALDVKRPVATAEFTIDYEYLDGGRLARQFVFNGQRTVDATLHPPEISSNPCHKPSSSVGVAHPTRGQLRERARTDSNGADAQAIAGKTRNQVVATAINTAGFLCARVTDLYPDSTGKMIAHCMEYRSGRGRVSYRIDADAGSVEQLD